MVPAGPVAGACWWTAGGRTALIAWTDLLGGLLVLGAAFLFFVLPPGGAALHRGSVRGHGGHGPPDTFSQLAIGASLPDLVPPERLEAANSLNLGGVQAAVFVAQGLAGLLFVLIGMPTLVLANALTYLYAGGSELFLRIPHRGRTAEEKKHPWQKFRDELLEGFRFVLAHRGLRTSLLLYMALNFFIAPVIVLLPFFVEDYLALGPQWYGYLMAGFGLGALLGYLAARRAAGPRQSPGGRGGGRPGRRSRRWCRCCSCARSRFPAAGVRGSSGRWSGIGNVNFISLLQAGHPARPRGRVQSLATTASAAVMPLGMALSGIVFDLVGKDVALMFLASGGITTVLSCSRHSPVLEAVPELRARACDGWRFRSGFDRKTDLTALPPLSGGRTRAQGEGRAAVRPPLLRVPSPASQFPHFLLQGSHA